MLNKNINNKPAFTLIELLVVIAIIGLLATLSIVSLNNARSSARDARRLADIKQIQTALELYYHSENSYPSTEEITTIIEIEGGEFSVLSGNIIGSSVTFMSPTPTAPTPADGSCSDIDNTYRYTQVSADNYYLGYCLGSETGGIPAGSRVADPTSLNASIPF